MSSLYEFLLLATVFFGVYASAVLALRSKDNILLNRLLAAVIVTFTAWYFLIFCVNRQWVPDLIVLVRTFTPILYILPALSFLYIRSFIREDQQLSRKDLWHALPFALNFLYVLPLINDIATGVLPWKQLMVSVDKSAYFFNHGPVPDRFHKAIKIGLLLFYIGLVWWLKLGKRNRDFLERNRETYAFSIRWISVFTIAITCNALFALLMHLRLFVLPVHNSLIFGDLVSLGMIVSFDLIVAYALLNPVVLFGLPHFRNLVEPGMAVAAGLPAVQAAESGQTITDSAKIPTATVPGTASTVTELPPQEPLMDVEEREKMIRLAAVMEDFVQKNRPFVQPDFNLLALSRMLKVPEHHLAYLFRHFLRKSFVDYRNELRVAFVKEELRKNSSPNLTVEALGAKAGFSSRATFFAVFRKHTGVTPAQYMNQPDNP